MKRMDLKLKKNGIIKQITKKVGATMFERKKYLKWIDEVRDTEFIKVITGVRRSGKSMLLKMVEQKLLESGVLTSQIVFLNFESAAFDMIKNNADLKTIEVIHVVDFLWEEV